MELNQRGLYNERGCACLVCLPMVNPAIVTLNSKLAILDRFTPYLW